MSAVELQETNTDVVEICALLQCMGFTVKSMDTHDQNMSVADAAMKTVVISCQSSGLNVVLEGGSSACSCPANKLQTSGIWHVSAVSGGKQHGAESGSKLFGSLPKGLKERVSHGLSEIIRWIKANDENGDVTNNSLHQTNDAINRSVSTGDLRDTPEKRFLNVKPDTPTRYRSLDTLTNMKEAQEIPNPGPLVKETDPGNANGPGSNMMCRRQSTYTLASTPSTSIGRRQNKTSSPIKQHSANTIENLLMAERAAEDLRERIASIIKDMADDKMDSSICSLALDVSKISLLKGSDQRSQFTSSPNLSRMPSRDISKRVETMSSSNLPKRMTDREDAKSKLKKMSPSIFKLKKDAATTSRVTKVLDRSALGRSKIVTPVRIPKETSASNPNLSSNKKRFSHVKSTIPKMTPLSANKKETQTSKL